MPEQTIKDKTAIVGIGWTAFSRNSGVTTLSLAAEASLKAIADAGLQVHRCAESSCALQLSQNC